MCQGQASGGVSGRGWGKRLRIICISLLICSVCFVFLYQRNLCLQSGIKRVWLIICCFPFAQFYSKNKDSIATTLLKPKPKQGAKSAEVELSKSETKGHCLGNF